MSRDSPRMSGLVAILQGMGCWRGFSVPRKGWWRSSDGRWCGLAVMSCQLSHHFPLMRKKGPAYAGEQSSKSWGETDFRPSRPEFGQDFDQKHGLKITQTGLAMNVISLPVQSVPDRLCEELSRKEEDEKEGKSLLSMILYMLQVKRENVLLHSCGYQTENLSLSSRRS